MHCAAEKDLPTSRFLPKRLCRKGLRHGRSNAERSLRPPVDLPPRALACRREVDGTSDGTSDGRSQNPKILYPSGGQKTDGRSRQRLPNPIACLYTICINIHRKPDFEFAPTKPPVCPAQLTQLLLPTRPLAPSIPKCINIHRFSCLPNFPAFFFVLSHLFRIFAPSLSLPIRGRRAALYMRKTFSEQKNRHLRLFYIINKPKTTDYCAESGVFIGNINKNS